MTNTPENKGRRGRPPLSPRAREAFRREVIGVARQLFVRDGYEAVSMRRIAAAAGCSPMKLYSYFRDKRNLLRRIWEDSLSRVMDALKPTLESDASAVSRVRAFGVGYVGYWLDHPDEYRVVFMNEDKAAGPDDAYYVHESDIVERIGWVSTVMAEGMANGEFVPSDANGCTQQLMCVCDGLAHMLITVPEFPWREHRALVEATIETFVRGITRNEKRGG